MIVKFLMFQSKLLTVFALLFSPFVLNAQESVIITNTELIQADYASIVGVNNSMTSDCASTLTVEIPEGSQVIGINAVYQVHAVGSAIINNQASFIRVLNEGGGVTPVQTRILNFGGPSEYQIFHSDIANGLTGSIEF